MPTQKMWREERPLGPILASLFICFFRLPLSLPYINWASQEHCLFYLRFSHQSLNHPLFYFHGLFPSLSFSYCHSGLLFPILTNSFIKMCWTYIFRVKSGNKALMVLTSLPLVSNAVRTQKFNSNFQGIKKLSLSKINTFILYLMQSLFSSPRPENSSKNKVCTCGLFFRPPSFPLNYYDYENESVRCSVMFEALWPHGL